MLLCLTSFLLYKNEINHKLLVDPFANPPPPCPWNPMSKHTALHERLAFMRITPETSRLLGAFWPVVEPRLQHILDGFYEHVVTVPSLEKLLADKIPRLKKAQKKHWERLFSGRFDEDYFQSVQAIGLIHTQIGLEPRWYIGGYNYVLSELTHLAIKKNRLAPEKLSALIRAINCAVMIDMDIAISTYQEALLEDRARRSRGLDTLMKAFQVKSAALLEEVAVSAQKLNETADTMASIARNTIEKSESVAAASEEASTNVQTVASAAEELSASVTEISRQVAQSSSIANKAVADAGRANEIVRHLDQNAQKIGDIVEMISAVAKQTNLLALNATIEAARAGEAGKGFAVVAGEVKHLAKQTSEATNEITSQIREIQSSTQEVVQAIQSISFTISEIDQISTAISAAVEEQGAATREIARNVQEASEGTRLVTVSITSVSQGADETGIAASRVADASGTLSRQAESLSKEVQVFLIEAEKV